MKLRRHIIRFATGVSVTAAAILAGLSASAQPFDPDRSARSDRSSAQWEQSFPVQSLRSSSPRQEFLQFAQARISAQEAKSIAMRRVPGSEFLDIRLIDGQVYRVRVIKDGRRIDVFVDAQTGRIRG